MLETLHPLRTIPLRFLSMHTSKHACAQVDAIFALTYILLSYPFNCVTTEMHVGGGEAGRQRQKVSQLSSHQTVYLSRGEHGRGGLNVTQVESQSAPHVTLFL